MFVGLSMFLGTIDTAMSPLLSAGTLGSEAGGDQS